MREFTEMCEDMELLEPTEPTYNVSRTVTRLKIYLKGNARTKWTKIATDNITSNSAGEWPLAFYTLM